MLLRDMLGVAPSCAARTEFEDYHNLGLVYFTDRQCFDTDCTEVYSVSPRVPIHSSEAPRTLTESTALSSRGKKRAYPTDGAVEGAKADGLSI